MKIRILGFDMDVIYQDDLQREHGKRGHYDSRKCQIKIDNGMNPQYQSECLIHEIVEVIDTELYLTLNHDEQLTKIATGFFQVLMDNKEVFKELLK